MRLFLYDFDLRLMYGIYKVAGRGGYDLRLNAFKFYKFFPTQIDLATGMERSISWIDLNENIQNNRAAQ